jgi:localization factor PodJL
LPRNRWLAIGALSLMVLFLCIGLSLGKGGASAAPQIDGVAYRHAPKPTLARLTAMADAGDAGAQAKLALIYLKGDGVPQDQGAALRWSRAAAQAGQPVAQYLLGALYREGAAVPADAATAFRWFAAAADRGNLKAMHNLATAYAQGLGTGKDEAKAVEWFTRAAERGYVDSAFNLAVLYERGLGVPQDLKQALTWYGIAAQLGDAPAEQRAQILRGQISQEAAKRAAEAAMNFSPLPPLGAANRL